MFSISFNCNESLLLRISKRIQMALKNSFLTKNLQITLEILKNGHL